MLFRRKSRRERMAASFRHLLPTRRTVALVAGVAALTVPPTPGCPSARQSSS